MPTITYEPDNGRLHYICITLSKAKNYQTFERQIPTRDLKKLVFPRDCTSFELYDRICHYDEQNNAIYVGEVVDRTQYYIGTTYTREQLKNKFGEEKLSKLEISKTSTDKIVEIYGGEFVNARAEDKVVSPTQLNLADNFAIAQTSVPEMTRG